MTLIVASLINVGWQVSFGVYALALSPFSMFGLFVPNDKVTELQVADEQRNAIEKVIKVEKIVTIIAFYLLVE